MTSCLENERLGVRVLPVRGRRRAEPAAPSLHRAFAERRVNHVNQRREFFVATPAEVRTILLEQVGNLLEFAEHPEATQYLQSKKYWPDGETVAGPS